MRSGFGWVNNVYNLCMPHGISSVQKFTSWQYTALHPLKASVKPQLIPKFIPSFPPIHSTVNFRLLPLVIRWLSPLSTAPIIKKMN